jgi:hypothetical protein
MESLRNKFSILQQKVLRSTAAAHAGGNHRYSLSHEPDEFEKKYSRLLEVRDALRKVEAAVRKFIKKSAIMAKAARVVGQALGTPPDDVKRLGDLLNTGLEDETLIKAIQSKVSLLDDTVKQRKKLEDLRLVRDHNQQRLQQTEAQKGKPGVDEIKLIGEIAKWKAKYEHCQREYEELLAELQDALDFISTTTEKDGPWALVGPELDAFRTTQGKLLHNVQELFAGLPPGTYKSDPTAAAEAVAKQMEEDAKEASVTTTTTATTTSGNNNPTSPAAGSATTTTTTNSTNTSTTATSSRPKPPKPPGGTLSDDDDDDDE